MKHFDKQQSLKIYLTLAVVGLLTLYLWPSLVVAMPLTAKQQMQRTWRLAMDIGSFTYRTDVVQTSYPTPKLENAGRSPRVQEMWLEGTVDRPNDAITMKLWLGTGRETIELKVENGQAYGRAESETEWTVVDENPADLFTPNGDPLGFLVAAENVQQSDNDGSTVAGLSPDSNLSYTFDINGREYADHVRQQLEATLRAEGSLPGGLSLEMTDHYANMDAHGQVWLTNDGLPVRQVIHMAFAPERDANNQIEAEITSTFSQWDTQSLEHQLFWAIPRLVNNPRLLVKDPLSLLPAPPAMKPATIERIQTFGFLLGLSLLLLALAIMTVTHGKSPKFYAATAGAMIALMLGTPLLQSNQTYAAVERFRERQFEQEQAQSSRLAAEQYEAGLRDTGFDPTINPLEGIDPTANLIPTDGEMATLQPAGEREGEQLLPALQPTCVITDSNSDCDGDGLSNGVEITRLGTDPNAIDTDGDRISDKVEVEGFIFNSKRWYLDPVNPDSNGDGLHDFLECMNLVDIDSDGTYADSQLGSTCNNSDGDTTPDVFDFDDDNDGVPDSVDSSPTYTGDLTTNTQSVLNLSLNNYTTNKTILVDFELRPSDPDNLWQTGNVFDWPPEDLAGQITRVFTTTFADVSGESDPAPRLGQGDVMLTPMLQVKMPAPISNTLNPAASLPISSTFSGNITTTPLTGWLDIDTTDLYAIATKEDAGEAMYAYVPLAIVEDQVGDTPVAWGGRMVYRPEQSNWGDAHEVRLMWLVSALVDYCDTTGLSNPDNTDALTAWCNDRGNWKTTTRLIQTYYDDFSLTGLTVTEDHGSKTAVVAQKDALSVNYESHLWQLSNGLQSTFITGDQITPGTRFTIEEIKQRFETNAGSYTDQERWDIPTNKLTVDFASATDQTTALNNLQTSVPNILNTTYSTPSTNDVVTLLFAREDTNRTVGLEEADAVTINGNAITVDLTPADTLLNTYTAVNWAPYRYNGSAWKAYDLFDYLLNDLEAGLQNEIDLSDLQAIVANQEIGNEGAAEAGAIMFAKNYYIAIYRGLADLVEVNGQLISEDVIDNLAFALSGQKPVAFITADMVELMATLVEEDRTLLVDGNVVANSDFEALQLRSLLLEAASFQDNRIIIANGTSKVGATVVAWAAKKFYKRVRNFSKTSLTYGKWSKRGGSILGFASITIAMGGPLVFKGMSERDALITAASIGVVGETLTVAGAVGKIDKLRKITSEFTSKPSLSTAVKAIQQTRAVKKVIKFGAVFGTIVEGLAAIGFTIYTFYADDIKWGTIQANLIISETIGQITAAIIFGVIAVTGIGALVVAVIGLIDVIIGLVCEALNVNPESAVRRWVCGGLSGTIATGTSYLIYDYYTPYDANNDNRLNIVFDSVNVIKTTDNEGFIAGNALQLTTSVTNTITLADPKRVIIKTSYLKPGTTRLDRERLKNIGKKSSFEYSINTTIPFNPESGLTLNPAGNWPPNSDQDTFTVSKTVPLAPGMNAFPNIYLTEAYNLATIECWGFIGADENATCDENKELKGSNNTNIGKYFVFDVLPGTINGFPDFFSAAYPQPDADGDGLLRAGSGIIDPDDNDWDSDDDGLSDFWEANNNGFDFLDPDSDDDGLFDYWEAFYQTRADLQDSDFEGLNDGDERFHSNARSAYEADNSAWSGGWTIVYDYDGSTALQTLVSADPLVGDTDLDNILDNLEFAYGYHPDLPSIVNVLTLSAYPDAKSYKPGSTINYTATVKNELDNRVAFGLLESEFPVDVVESKANH
jgi:hypothetical protein